MVYNRLRPGETFDDRHIELLTPVSAVHFDFVHLVADRFQALPSHRFRVLTSKWYNNSDFSDMLAGYLSDCQTETEFVQQMRAYFRQIPQDIVNLPNDTRFLLNGQLSVAFVHGTVTFPVPGVASPHLRGIFRIGARQAGTGYLAIDTNPLPNERDRELLRHLLSWFREHNPLYRDVDETPLTVESLRVRLDPQVQGAAVVSARIDSEREPMSDFHNNVRIRLKDSQDKLTTTFVSLELALSMSFPLLFPFPLPRIPGTTFRQKARAILSSHEFFRCGRLQCHLILFLYNLIEDQATWFPQTRLSIQPLVTPSGTNRDIPSDLMFNDPSTQSYWRKRQAEVRAMCHEFGDPDLMLTLTFVNKWPEVRRFEEKISQLYGYRIDIRFCPMETMMIWKSRFYDIKKHEFQKLVTAMGFGSVVHYVWRLEFQARGAPHVHALIWLSNPVSHDIIKRSMFAVHPNQELPRLSRLVLGPMVHQCSLSRCKKGDPTLRCKYGFPKPVCSSLHVTDNGELYLPRTNSDQWIVDYSPALLLKWNGHCHVHVLRTEEHPGCSPNAIHYIVKYNFKSEPSIRVEAAHQQETYETLFHSRVTSSEEAIARIFSFDYHGSDTGSIYISLKPPDRRTASFVAGQQVQITPVEKYFQRPPELSQLRILSFFSLYEVFPVSSTNEELLGPGSQTSPSVHRCPGTLINSTWEQHNLPPLCMVSEALLRPSSHLPKARALGCRLREHPIIVLTDRFSLATDQETLAYASLLMSGSWRSDDEISSGCPSYVDALSYHGLQPLEIDELTRLNRTLLDYMLASTRYTTRDIAHTLSCMSTDLRTYLHSLFSSSDRWRQSRITDILATLDTLDITLPDNLSVYEPPEGEILRQFINANFTTQEIDEAGTMVNDMLPLLNAGQRIIYDHIAHVIGLNVPINIYVSGSAGTGKSFLISLLQAKFRTINMSYVTCASTGIAARLINGRTVHSTFKLYDDGSDNIRCGLHIGTPAGRAISVCKMILIDEVTMVPRKTLDALDLGLRRLAAQVNGPADLPFGGKHILLFGDLAQVPAVVYTRDDYSESANQFFEATCYSQFTRFSLSQVMRQIPNETDFLALLADVRDAQDSLSPNTVQLLRSRFIAGTMEDVIDSIDTFVGQDSADGMVITFTNNKAQLYNNMVLGRRASSHQTPIFNLDASFCVREPAYFLARPGASPDTEPRQVRTRLASDTEIRIFFAAFRRRLFNSIIPAHLRLCPGARVMLLQNIDPNAGLINGSRGTVIDYIQDVNALAVKFDDRPPDEAPTLLTRRPSVEYSLDRGQHIFMLQFPVKLCWAVTAHKAQGQTLTKIAIDISDSAFAHGALYVALSRVRSLDCVLLFGLEEFPENGPLFHTNPYIRWQDHQPDSTSVMEPPPAEPDF